MEVEVNIKYEMLQKVSVKQAVEIGTLLRVLSDTAELPSMAQIQNVLDENYMVVAVDTDREDAPIVGMATLITITQLVGKRGRVEDVAVLPSCGGKGIGRGLMEHLHSYARVSDIPVLALSSRPNREAANALYVKLGYKKIETNVYVIDLTK